MGDPHPLHVDLIIKNNTFAVIQAVETAILRIEHIGCQRCPLLRHFADIQLKFGKHGLAVQRAAELLQEVIDEVSTLFFIGCFREQMLHKQRFIAGGSDLRNKDHIFRIERILVLVGKIRMQRMTHFVRQGELAVQRSGIVEQDKRMHLCACAVGTGAFAGIFINVDPAVVKALLQNFAVVVTQRCQRIIDIFLCFFDRRFFVYTGNQRCV